MSDDTPDWAKVDNNSPPSWVTEYKGQPDEPVEHVGLEEYFVPGLKGYEAAVIGGKALEKAGAIYGKPVLEAIGKTFVPKTGKEMVAGATASSLMGAGTKVASDSLPNEYAKYKPLIEAGIPLSLAGIGYGAYKLGNMIPELLPEYSSVANKDSLKAIYKAFKDEDPSLREAVQKGTKLLSVDNQPLPMPSSRMNYNYARELGVPHEYAVTAEDFTRGTHPQKLGAWDLLDKVNEEARATGRPLVKYENWEKLNLPEKIKLAHNAGVDTSSILPEEMINTKTNMPRVMSKIRDIEKWPLAIATAMHPWGVAKHALELALQSPRAAGEMAKLAGTASRITPQWAKDYVVDFAPSTLKSSANPASISGAEISETNKKANGGSIMPMSLKHVYFHRKKRAG